MKQKAGSVRLRKKQKQKNNKTEKQINEIKRPETELFHL